LQHFNAKLQKYKVQEKQPLKRGCIEGRLAGSLGNGESTYKEVSGRQIKLTYGIRRRDHEYE
jgi:hypothetical protein